MRRILVKRFVPYGVLLAVACVCMLGTSLGTAGEAAMLSGDPSGDPLLLPDGCDTCNQPAVAPPAMRQPTMQPPWHRSVRPPACGPCGNGPCITECNQGCDPCCDPCCEPQEYVMPPCFPRLHAMFCGGYLLSPRPPRMPRCPQCGCHIPDGF